MKKLIGIYLALVLAAGMGSFSAVNAVDVDYTGSGTASSPDTDSSTAIGVTAKYEADSTVKDTYYVEVNYSSLTFQYTVGGAIKWNPYSLKNDNETFYDFTSPPQKVTVTNKSNIAVDVTIEASTSESEDENVEVSVNPAKFSLESAANDAYIGNPNLAPLKQFSVSVRQKTGDNVHPPLSGTSGQEKKVGTVTVTIAKQVSPQE